MGSGNGSRTTLRTDREQLLENRVRVTPGGDPGEAPRLTEAKPHIARTPSRLQGAEAKLLYVTLTPLLGYTPTYHGHVFKITLDHWRNPYVGPSLPG